MSKDQEAKEYTTWISRERELQAKGTAGCKHPEAGA